MAALLEPAQGFNGAAKGDRITHRIPTTKASEIDDEVKKRVKTAYDLDA
jgi:hypothetical protein